MRSPLVAVLAVAFAVGCFVAGRWSAPRSHSAAGKRILYYYDPMHPAYKSDKPGIAPDCGMELEPFYEGQAAPARPGAVRIEPARRRLAGVEVASVQRNSATHMLRLPSRIAADETRIARIVTGAEGLIREVQSPAAGSIVRKDELLATYYARDFLSAQQAYIYALKNVKSTVLVAPGQEQANRLQFRQIVDTLESLGMSDYQMRRIAESGQPATLIDVRAPATSIILARNAAVGQRFDRNTELYRLADLTHVWIFADIFERDARFIRPGQPATLLYQGRKIPVRMSDILPQFDPATRTMKLRFEADNPDLVLRPDMYADVEIPVSLPAAIPVPVDAVVDSGLRKIVYVESAAGEFEPRQIEAAWQMGDRVGISSGLKEGERIVVAGTFLVDSETRLQTGSSPAAPAPKDPVCGMEVNPAKAVKLEYGGKAYSFCSDHCRKEFEKNPAKYTTPAKEPAQAKKNPARYIEPPAAPRAMEMKAAVEPGAAPPAPGAPPHAMDMHAPGGPAPRGPAPAAGSAAAKDPVCGMDADPDGPTAEYGGKTYHFCSEHCKKEFQKNPARYAGKKAAA